MNTDEFITKVCREKPEEVKDWLIEHGYNPNENLKTLDDSDIEQMNEDLYGVLK